MNKLNIKKLSIDIIADVFGGVLIAVAAYNFAAAAEFPMVGMNGIALIFYHLFGLPIGTVALILNIPIGIICYKTLGRDFLIRSIRSIIITSFIMDFIAPLFPMYKGDPLLAAICTGVLSGIGYGIIYMRDSSTGGTDFIIMAVKALKPHLSIGKISFIMEALIIIVGTIAVSRQADSFIYAMIISFVMSAVIDRVMYGISAGKLTLIVTKYPKEVAEKINETAGRGATFLKARGSYAEEDRDVVMCACSTKEMHSIKSAANAADKDAFIIIMESNEVLGEGFQLPK